MTFIHPGKIGALAAIAGLLIVVGSVGFEPADVPVDSSQTQSTSNPNLEDKFRQRLLGRKVDDFKLDDAVSGKPWQLSLQKGKARAVVFYFLSTECPVTNRYTPALSKIQAKFAKQKVVVVAINSNVQDTVKEIKQHAKEYSLEIPVLSDAQGVVARMLGAKRTGEAIVLDADMKVRFRGVIDDRYERGITKPKATRAYLEEALTAVLNGRPVKTSITDVTACPLNLAKEKSKSQTRLEKVTYSEHVAAIIQRRCQSCHRPKGVGPFKLMNYADAKNWSQSIREVITQNLMPPWHADAPHGHFVNDRSLTDQEYKTLLDWIDDGAIEGDKSKLPKPRTFSNSWSIGKPDLVAKMDKSVEVPAETPKLGVPYKYIWAGKPFEKETWVKAAEVRPGATEVVHHASVYIVPKGVEIKLENDERPSNVSELFSPTAELPHLVSFVPGDNAFVHPQGLAKRIPKGARLIFEMHYTPVGKKAVDRTEVGLVFAKKPPRHEVFDDAVLNYMFSIPPGVENHRVMARSRKLKRDIVLLSMNPHMHYRGKSFKYESIDPSGKRSLLLNVPRYNFEWQSTYTLAKPIHISKGSRIVCTAVFDNSKHNPFNPDPKARVQWGEQTWQEMMLGSYEYYEK